MQRFIEGIVTRLQMLFDPEALGAVMARVIANVLVALAVFAAFSIAWLLLKLMLRAALRQTQVDATSASFVMTVAKYVTLTIGAVSALDAAGVQTGAVLTSLGIVGLTIGFAARDALSNLISGILIFIDRPFVIDDLVELEDAYGRVARITLRSTRVVTPDGRMLAIPNSEVINKRVASYTNFPNLRVDIPVTIAVTENLSRTRELLLGLVRVDQDYLETPAPRVVVTRLNDYNVQLELQAWRDERTHIEKRFELRERVFEALRQAGVEMPFETLQLAPMEVRVADPGRAA
ncbi:MAG: mechanosensitive ion channel family protein [Gemmatimonadales bacterium]